MIIKHAREVVTVDDIQNGEVFRCETAAYFICTDKEEEKYRGVVNIESGEFLMLSKEAECSRVNAYIVIRGGEDE